MIFIDYPPGGLGHFIAQVFTNNFSKEDHVSFHRIKSKSYDATLSQSSQELFLKKLTKWQPKYPVSIGHSWGAIDQLKNKVKCKIISVEVNQCWPELFLNVYNKAMVDNLSANKNPSIAECNNFYNYMLTCFNVDNSLADIKINFDNFYGSKENFFNEIKKINPDADVNVVYNIFCTTQQPIIDRLKYLKQLSQQFTINEPLVNFEKVLITRLQNKNLYSAEPEQGAWA